MTAMVSSVSNGDNRSESEEIGPRIPLSVPTPTREYRARRKLDRQTLGPGTPRLPTPFPLPIPIIKGSRVLLWKQDPAVLEIGIRKAFLPGLIKLGPADGRISIQGMPSVAPNVNGDFIETPGAAAFDSVHTFAVVWQTLKLFQRALGAPLPWQWNAGGNVDPIGVFPHAGATMNAFYARSQRALKFFFFDRPGAPPGTKVFTCRSFDIVAHETGHAVLDALKPDWLLASSPPQTGALHESFGDLTAIFLALSQLDQVEAIVAQTRANLHDKTFISDLAEEFGMALGRPNGLRNADNDLKLSDVSSEVHDLSQVFTGGIYDVLADIFAFERAPARKDDAAVLHGIAQYLHSVLVRAIVRAPASGASFANVVNEMLKVLALDGKPVQYRNFVRNRFTLRQIVISPTPLAENLAMDAELAPDVTDAPDAQQTRNACCGTMQLAEYEDRVDADGDYATPPIRRGERGGPPAGGARQPAARS